ncbi:MAG: toxic anion resistance protein [Candidatus Pacebacteria bacterium]|nr:toxic anion resistance protein [Candidatus Paceibacterota bacterium]
MSSEDKREEKTVAVIVKPKGLDEAQEQELISEADKVVQMVLSNPQDRQLPDKIQAIGRDAQEGASRKIQLLDARLGSLMSDATDDESKITQGLIDLRVKMDQINPHTLGKPPVIVQKFPFLTPFWSALGLLPNARTVLTKIKARHQTVKTSLDSIIEGLFAGKDVLLEDIVELEALYQGVQVHQADIQQKAYVCDMIMEALDEKSKTAGDELDKQRISMLLHQVATKAQDLRTMEQANEQFFVSLDMTIEGNRTLSGQIDRVATVTRALLAIGIAITAALQRQRKVAGAVQAGQDYAGDLLVNNASNVRTQSVQIAEMANNPVIAIAKAQEAHDNLAAAIEETEQVRNSGLVKARESIAALKSMNSTLAPKRQALHDTTQNRIGG